MTSVSIHGPTGVLLVDGRKVFPIGLSDPPPHDALAPSGQHAFQELANAGATMIRSGTPDWQTAGDSRPPNAPPLLKPVPSSPREVA